MDKLFLHFGAMYGPIWQKRYDNADYLRFCKEQWALALAQFSGKDIRRAINRCLYKHKLPPSLPEFIQICQQYALSSQGYVKREALPKPQMTDVAKLHLEKLYELLEITKQTKEITC